MAENEQRRRESQESGAADRQEYWLQLYQQHHEEIRRYIARDVRHPHDVDDLVQTVFLNLMVHNGNWRNPRAYLYTIARNQVSFYRRYRRRSVLIEQTLSVRQEEAANGVSPGDGDSDPLWELARTETQTVVGALIARLSPALLEAVHLRFMDGLRLRQAAARAGCSCVALKKRLERAKQSLMETLGARGNRLD